MLISQAKLREVGEVEVPRSNTESNVEVAKLQTFDKTIEKFWDL